MFPEFFSEVVDRPKDLINPLVQSHKRLNQHVQRCGGSGRDHIKVFGQKLQALRDAIQKINST